MISYNIQRTNDLAQPELVVVNERDPVNYAVVDSEEVRECSKCGSKQFSFKQEKKRSILDVIQKIGIKDRLIMLHYRFAQFSCNYKKHLFTRRITFVRKGKRLTARLEQYVFRKCLEKPAVSVEHELTALSVNKSIKISDTEIQSTFLDVTRILDSVAPQVWATPKTMGIHRARIGKHDSYVVLNIEEECIIDLLRDSEYSTLKGFAEKIINANDVEVIWLDLDGKLVSNIKEIFPNAELRIGREQVGRYLEKCIQSFLKEDRYKPNGMRESTLLKPREEIKSKRTLKNLDEYLTEHQSIAKLYEYNQSIRSASLNQIKEVIQGISDYSVMSEPAEIWLKEDVTYFKNVITQAYGVPMLNSEGKDISEDYYAIIDEIVCEHLEGIRNCTFEVMRGRVVYSSRDPNEGFEKGYRKAMEMDIKDPAPELDDGFRYMALANYRMFYEVPNCAIGLPIEDVRDRLRMYDKKYK